MSLNVNSKMHHSRTLICATSFTSSLTYRINSQSTFSIHSRCYTYMCINMHPCQHQEDILDLYPFFRRSQYIDNQNLKGTLSK
jgi:hypothetical protein